MSHEIWVICPHCHKEYDQRLHYYDCPFCKKNINTIENECKKANIMQPFEQKLKDIILNHLYDGGYTDEEIIKEASELKATLWHNYPEQNDLKGFELWKKITLVLKSQNY